MVSLCQALLSLRDTQSQMSEDAGTAFAEVPVLRFKLLLLSLQFRDALTYLYSRRLVPLSHPPKPTAFLCDYACLSLVRFVFVLFGPFACCLSG